MNGRRSRHARGTWSSAWDYAPAGQASFGRTVSNWVFLAFNHVFDIPYRMCTQFDELLGRLNTVHDLEAAAELLEWDQEVNMPDAATEARARQVATLSTLAHQHFTDERTGGLLSGLKLSPDSWQASLVEVAREDFERERKIPAELVNALAEASGRAKAAWRQAREDDDFALFAPHLDSIVALCIEKAQAIGYRDHPYDALLDIYEPGMTTAQVRGLFDKLRNSLVPIVQTIAARPAPNDAYLFQTSDTQAQWDYGIKILRAIGYDLSKGRQDKSAHPFSTSFSINDVRITTRLHANNLCSGLFSTLHEAGHGMYEQGVDAKLEGTLLARGTSLGMHESQSRLWENQIGRSLPFWRRFYPSLQTAFPDVLRKVTLEQFYHGINKVTASPIRVESDEVTYNLHIMLRFEIEQLLIEKAVTVAELPDLWRAKMQQYLGIEPATDAEGVLQDIHWSLGAIGYFPTYALGNLMSAQIFACARQAIPDMNRQIAGGEFGQLGEWLRANIHHWGRRRKAGDLIKSLTGESLTAKPWLDYIRQKYGEIYGPLP